MRIIIGDNYERFVLTIDCGDKPFSVFFVSENLYYNMSLDKQKLEFFENTFTDYGEKFNSGERILEIEINSEEERYELSYLFIRQGFKIRQPKEIDWFPGEYSIKRVYTTEKDLNLVPDGFGRLYPYCNKFYLYLRKKRHKEIYGFS